MRTPKATPYKEPLSPQGVGIIVAAAKNVGKMDDEQAKMMAGIPGMAVPEDDQLEIKDWVIALPDARLKPIGCWSNLCVADTHRLLKVREWPSVHPYACSALNPTLAHTQTQAHTWTH